MEIKKLNCDVISKIRSSFNIKSVAQCVFELVCNSLDAKSTSIAVRINLITFKIQVADNGEGITKENLELLGVRYMTSKCHNLAELEKHLNTYGFRGEALASIVPMCRSVSISSRYRNSPETYTTTLQNDLKGVVKLTKYRASVGTTVTVLGFLNNLPVRQRRVIQEIELEEVKKYIESLVIINPASSFSLRNDVTGLLIVNSRKSDDIIGSFRHLHPDITDSFTLLKVSKTKVSIDALIHKEFILSKKFQYIYVNKRPVISHKLFNNFNSSFCKKMRLQTKRNKHPIFDTKRYPVFVLNIKCSQSNVDIFMGPSKSDVEFKCWDLVLACIEKIIKTFFGLDDKIERAAPERLNARVSCGVSQVLGAVQACGYKRKSNEAIGDAQDQLGTDSSQNGGNCIKKSRLSPMEKKKKEHSKKNKPVQNFATDKTSVLPISQRVEGSGNYQIEDTGMEPFLKPRKLKSIIKKPLPIKIEPKIPNMESKLNKGSIFELELADSRREVQFDQKSVYSRLNNDEDQGKNLIMDMFLKSTQVFTGEVSNIPEENCSTNISCDTIEESNFVMENNIHDAIKGINTTMSISVNVKKKKIRDQKKNASKHVQTSIIEDRLNKMTSKCVQTSQKPALKRVRSNLSDLTHQFDGFKLSHDYRDNEKDNYTILINTVRKKTEFRFVRKSEEMDVDGKEVEKSFRPLKICYCREDDEKIFKFGQAEKKGVLILNDKSDFGQTIPLKSLFEKSSKHQMAAITDKASTFPNSDSEAVFKKPQPPAINDPHPITLHGPKYYSKIGTNNLNFRGLRKHTSSSARVELCEKSPFFTKKKKQTPTSVNNNFKPKFKSTQVRSNNLENLHIPRKNVVSSPYFARNRREDIRESNNVYLPRAIRNEYLEFDKRNNQIQSNFPQYNLNQVHHNAYQMEDYHNFNQNYSNTDHYNNIGNDGFYPIRYGDNYGRPTNTNTARPPYCCMYPPENHRQYFNMPNDLKAQNAFKQNFSHCKEDIWHRNNENINIGLITSSAVPECRDLAMNSDVIQTPKLLHDCNVDSIDTPRKETQSLQPMEENSFEEAPWYTPNVSDENMYFDRSLSEPEEQKPNKRPFVFGELENLTPKTHQNSEVIDGKPNKIVEEKAFNFRFSCTPDIFSNSEVCKTVRSSEKDRKNPEINTRSGNTFCVLNKQDFHEPSQNIPPNFNGFFDLASFGIVDSKNDVGTTNNVCPSKEDSDLEVTVPDGQEKQDIIERKLLGDRKNNGNRFVSYESAEKIKSRINDDETCTKKSRIMVDSQNEWVRKCNMDGKGFYVNKRTGMVTSSTPKIDEGFFTFERRLDFVPKGMSPVLKEHKKIDRSLSQNAKSKLQDFILESYDNELMVIKWQHFIDDASDPKIFFEEIYKEKSKQFENGIPSIHDSAINNKHQKDMVGFDSKLFNTIDVIGQVDRKFIAVLEKTKNLVLLFDQHAVHERIRVEQFLKEYKGLRTPCKEKFTFFMPRYDLGLLKKHSEYISSLGLDVEYFTDGLKILSIPLCVEEKFYSRDNSEDLSKIIHMLIKEIIDSLKETRGSTSQLPKIILNVVNLKACRGAIKFGDCLTKEDCKKLLNDLSKCNLPFQCAHGRPTLTPVLTLSKSDVKEKIKKLDFKKLFNCGLLTEKTFIC